MKIKVEEDNYCAEFIETTASSHETSAQKRKACELELSSFLVSKNESLRKFQRQNTSMTPRLCLPQTRIEIQTTCTTVDQSIQQLDNCSQKSVSSNFLSIDKPLTSARYHTEVIPVSTKACVVNQKKLSRNVIVTPDITAINSERLVKRTFIIVAERCGEFIGYDGSNIKLIEEYIKARISLHKVSTKTSGIRKIQVEGLQHSITFFAKIIDAFKKSMSFLNNRKVTWVHEIVASLNENDNKKIIESKQQYKLGPNFLNTSDALIMSASHTISRSVCIPVVRAGEFFGIKASHIYEIQAFTNTVITIPKLTTNNYRTIYIKGSEACVKKTLRLIEYFCSSTPNNSILNQSWVPSAIKKLTKSRYESTDKLNSAVGIIHSSTSCNESYPTSISGLQESKEISYLSSGIKNSKDTNSNPTRETESDEMKQTPNKSLSRNNCKKICPATKIEPKLFKTIMHPTEDNSQLLDFLKTQVTCLKCSPEEFCNWLRSEDICSLSDLLDAFTEDEFVRNDMQNNGLKGFKRQTLQKACTVGLIDTNS